MEWYVRHEADGSITGPFDKELALEMADMSEGMVFSSDIFESDKVHEMLMAHLKSAIRDADTAKMVRDLRATRTNVSITNVLRSYPTIHKHLASLDEQAAEMILMLAGEPPEKLPADVSEMVDWLRGLADVGGASRNFGKIADRLGALSRTREVTATVMGGVFDVESMDGGVHLVVRDYDDPEYGDEDEDSDGNSCNISEYGG